MKISKKLYNKLILQAQEAETLGMTKLASDVMSSVESFPEDIIQEYSHDQMEADIATDLWKMATRLLNYYQVDSLDIEKLNKVIEASSEMLIDDLKKALGKENVAFGALEPKVLGQS